MADLSVDELRPCPTGRAFFVNAFQAVNCQATFIQSLRDETRARLYIFDSTSHQPKIFEDEDDDEYEDDWCGTQTVFNTR